MMATSTEVIGDEPGGSMAWRISGPVGAALAVFFHGLGGHRSSWDPLLSALGGLRWCPACDLPGYGRSPSLPSALPELGSTGAHWTLTWAAGLSTSSACTTLSGSRFPTSTCSASSTWGDGRAGQTCDPYHDFEAKGHVRLPADGRAGGD
jgi:pimeloyl-ACP methyl ester carboxylesterase